MQFCASAQVFPSIRKKAKSILKYVNNVSMTIFMAYSEMENKMSNGMILNVNSWSTESLSQIYMLKLK